MRGEAKPNGDVVLILTDNELCDVERALVSGEDACRELAKLRGNVDSQLNAEEAADWLAQLSTAIDMAIGRLRPGLKIVG